MHVELLEVMGSDLTVVDAARCSYGESSEEMTEKDIKLINYLAKHKHWSPFRHVMFRFHVSCPEFVARQWYKHIVGSDYTFKDTAWNEFSQRYAQPPEEVYSPIVWRAQASTNKQASGAPLDSEAQNLAFYCYNELLAHSRKAYAELLRLGVSREQARAVLPLAQYTSFVWTASLQAVYNFVKLRSDGGSQDEIRTLAFQVGRLVETQVPISWEALNDRA